MSWPTAVLSFAIVAGLLTIIPGLDTALVLRSALSQGRPQAYATALGISCGALVWGIAAAVGVSVLLTASTLAYTVVRIAGSAYLIWLGGRLLWAALHAGGPEQPEPAAGSTSSGLRRAWLRGLSTNVLNPKIGAFYVAVLPQFIPAHANHLVAGLVLALVHDAEGMLWFSGIILAAGAARRWLSRRAARRGIDGLTGAALVGFGLTLGGSAH